MTRTIHTGKGNKQKYNKVASPGEEGNGWRKTHKKNLKRKRKRKKGDAQNQRRVLKEPER